MVQAELTRISRLVDDLLVLAKTDRSQTLRIAPVDLPSFLGELWHGVSLLADRRFQLGPVPPGTLYADPDLLAQALRNLIVNAIEHTSPRRGLVSLRVRAGEGGGVCFLVEDDGPGIPVAEREQISIAFTASTRRAIGPRRDRPGACDRGGDHRRARRPRGRGELAAGRGQHRARASRFSPAAARACARPERARACGPRAARRSRRPR